MFKKTLPLGHPLVKCFLYDAYPLSILSVDDKYLPWFYSNYIQLCCHKNYLLGDSCYYEDRPWNYNRYINIKPENIQEKNGVFLEFFGPNQALSSPWIKLEMISWDILSKCSLDIINLIKTHINNNYYFYGYVNEYYIKNREAYLNYNFSHDILIYGYDDNEQVFYTSGYSKGNLHNDLKVTYQNFLKAFINNNQSKDKYYWTDRIYFLQKNNQTTYPLNISFIYKSINEYIYSQNSSNNYARYSSSINNMTYGISVYETLIEYLKLLSNGKIDIDLRIPNLLLEHKKCMKLRIKFIMQQSNSMINNYESIYKQSEVIEENAEILQSLLIKYKLTSNRNIITTMINLLKDIRTQEYNMLCRFMDVLAKEYKI